MLPHLGGVPGCRLVYPVPLLESSLSMYLHLWSPRSLPLWLVYHGHKVLPPNNSGRNRGTEKGRLESLEVQPLALSVLSAKQLTELMRWKAGGYRADNARALHTNHVNWIIATSWCLVLTQP